MDVMNDNRYTGPPCSYSTQNARFAAVGVDNIAVLASKQRGELG